MENQAGKLMTPIYSQVNGILVNSVSYDSGTSAKTTYAVPLTYAKLLEQYLESGPTQTSSFAHYSLESHENILIDVHILRR